MMRRALGVGALLTGLLLVSAQQGFAQWAVGLGAGALVPVSDYGDYAKTGWGVTGHLNRALNENASFVASASYGSNSHEDEGDKTNLIGVGGNLVYSLTAGAGAVPFLVGGVGYLGHQYQSDTFPDAEGTDWQAYVNGGVGLGFPLGSIRGYLLANYVHGFDETTYASLGGGITFPVGG